MLPACTLLPTTKRLKQLIAVHGSLWHTLTEPEPLQCFDGAMGIMIISNDAVHKRNVRLTDLDIT